MPLPLRPALLSLCCCLLFLTLASPLSLSLRADAARPASGASAASAAADWSDEFDGLDADESPREFILEDDERTPNEQVDGAAPSSSLDVFTDPAAALVSAPSARAFDAERSAVRLDWLHVNYEIRAISAQEDDDEENEETTKGATDAAASTAATGRLVDSSRKLGRTPLVFQLGGGSGVLPEVEEVLLGAKIGEQREVTLSAERSAALVADADGLAMQPRLAAGSLRRGERLRLRLQLLRFDEDVRQLTMEDRFWNLLPMLAFMALIGFRAMRPAMEAMQQPEGGAAAAAAAAGAAGGVAAAAASKRTKQR